MALIANDDTAQTSAGVPVTVNVLANDTLDGAPVQLSDLSGPPAILSVTPEGAGTAVTNPDGTVTYAPAEGFEGEAEVEYQISTDSGCAEGSGFRTGNLSLTIPPAWWDSVADGDEINIAPESEEWVIVYSVQDGDVVFVAIYDGEPPYEADIPCIIYHGRGGEILAQQCIHFTWTAI